MTPAERLILATLADVYEQFAAEPHRKLGPYGVAADRLGLRASRVGEVESAIVGWSMWNSYSEQARLIREVL